MLGIDIGSYSIKAAVIKKSGKRASIEQFASEVLPSEMRGGRADIKTLQNIVAGLIKKVGKGQSDVALSIPTSSAILKTITIDANLNGDLLEGEVQLELVNFVPFPLDQVYADFVPMGISAQNSELQDVFVAASRRDIVDKIANTVNVKSIKNKQVDIEVFAIGQVVEHLQGPGYKNVCAVVDIGYAATTVCVFQAGEMLFSRDQQVGGQHLTEAIAEAGGMASEEAERIKLTSINTVAEPVMQSYLDSLSEQVALAFEFFSSTNTQDIDVVYVTGGGSMVPGVIDSLSDNLPSYRFIELPLGQEVKIGKKTNGIGRDEVVATAAVVSGLGMRK